MTPVAITILTPTYKQDPAKLQRCLSSVRRQSFEGWRQIVCSDGVWEPEAADLVHGQDDPRVLYRTTAKRHGDWGAGVRAELLPDCATKYLAFLDSDNILFPRFLELMIAELEANPEAMFAICEILHFGPLPFDRDPPPVVLPGFPQVGMIDTLQVVVRTGAMAACGWTTGEYTADGLTYARLASMFRHVRVPHVLGAHL